MIVGPVRPSGFPDWCATGATNVTEPLDVTKAAGWRIGEQPTSSYFNWYMQAVSRAGQYLSWRASLRPYVTEDFSYDFNGAGGTAFGQNWYAFAPGGGIAVGAGTNGEHGGVQIGFTNSGLAEVRKPVGDIKAGQDFYMEHIVSLIARPTGVGSLEMGLFKFGSGITGSAPILAWMMTGSTGAVGVRWIPSGAAPTCMVFGAMPSNASGIHKFTVEARSPTMAFYVDDQLQGAAPYVPVKDPAGVASFGVRQGGPSGGYQTVMDYLELSVSRS